jgi:hypothetical protein
MDKIEAMDLLQALATYRRISGKNTAHEDIDFVAEHLGCSLTEAQAFIVDAYRQFDPKGEITAGTWPTIVRRTRT